VTIGTQPSGSSARSVTFRKHLIGEHHQRASYLLEPLQCRRNNQWFDIAWPGAGEQHRYCFAGGELNLVQHADSTSNWQSLQRYDQDPTYRSNVSCWQWLGNGRGGSRLDGQGQLPFAVGLGKWVELCQRNGGVRDARGAAAGNVLGRARRSRRGPMRQVVFGSSAAQSRTDTSMICGNSRRVRVFGRGLAAPIRQMSRGYTGHRGLRPQQTIRAPGVEPPRGLMQWQSLVVWRLRIGLDGKCRQPK